MNNAQDTTLGHHSDRITPAHGMLCTFTRTAACLQQKLPGGLLGVKSLPQAFGLRALIVS